MKIAFLVLLLFSTSLIAGESSPAPTKFEAAIGGFLGASYRVELIDGSCVAYYHNLGTFADPKNPNTRKRTFNVSAEQWLRFKACIDAAGVWKWETQFINPSIQDGTVWHFLIKYPDQSVESSGRNAFPPKKQFDAFEAAVRELIGGNAFQ